ncbi:MAG TPA: DUF721 domain-containing protein [Actinomycetota bacterium]|nr:DUF721 domain-containing protein [Actinomycetota bacterium]
MKDEPARIKDVLKGLGGHMGIKAPAETAALWSKWKDIVGESVAQHASPSSLREGVLRVRVDSSTWATEIGYLASEIRSRVNAALGSAAVTEVRVWVGSKKDAQEQAGSASPGPRKTPPKRRPRNVDADPIEAFERARGAWFKNTRGMRSGPHAEPSESPEKSR